MNDSMILAVGIFAFVMALIGVAFTVYEFRTTMFPKPERETLTKTERRPGHAH